MRNRTVCLDTSYLIGLFDEADLWHFQAREIHRLIRQHQVEVLYLDCVVNELFTVLARRCRERGKPEAFQTLVDQVAQAVPETFITWVYPHLPRWYGRCISLMRETHGSLNFHDVLIVMALQELGLSAIISFDAGFDQAPAVRRLGSRDALEAWVRA